MSGVIVNLGPGILAARLRSGGTEPVYVGWGIGGGTTAKTDTTLFSEVAADLTATTGTRFTGTSSLVTTTNTNDTWQLVVVMTVAQGGNPTATSSVSVTNLGLFDSATIGAGTLFAKTDYVNPFFVGDVLTVTFQCPIAD